jgi:hypothetical protein
MWHREAARVCITLSSVVGHDCTRRKAVSTRIFVRLRDQSCESQKSLQCPGIVGVSWRVQRIGMKFGGSLAFETSRSVGRRSTALTRVCTTQSDNLHTKTTQLEGRAAVAGILISRRQLLRHCAAETFDAQKLPAVNNLEEWFIAPGLVAPGARHGALASRELLSFSNAPSRPPASSAQ